MGKEVKNESVRNLDFNSKPIGLKSISFQLANLPCSLHVYLKFETWWYDMVTIGANTQMGRWKNHNNQYLLL